LFKLLFDSLYSSTPKISYHKNIDNKIEPICLALHFSSKSVVVVVKTLQILEMS
jgi:hypothetical protein